MKKKLTGVLALSAMILLVPCLITMLFGRGGTALPVSGQTSGDRVELSGSSRSVGLQEYLIGVTAAQLPGACAPEAVKAQMILNRTYYYSVLGSRTVLSADELGFPYLSAAEREEKWAEEGCEEASEVYLQAAVATENQVMTCRRRLAAGMFHRASTGRTRSMADSYPYMQSVDSGWDREMDGFITAVEYSAEALAGRLEELTGIRPEPESLAGSIQILEKDGAGYVISLMIGTEIFSGDDLASRLGLPSPAFSLQRMDNGILRFVCLGHGHGYGMSQYGASRMALEGKTALEILQYYFQNVAVESWKKDA